ncbi:MAG: flagellar basal body-associated protein FliL [Rhodobacteraceae bacterium]|nr:flagellar basal body-associated protein FliL [Paracoccaceae bacterium]
MRKLLPVLLALAGLALGAEAGLFLRPAAVTPTADGSAPVEPAAGNAAQGAGGKADGAQDYVKLNNQFIVPIVKSGRVASLVILSLSLQVSAGTGASVYAAEPKLRDAFLQVLFDHANAGGFSGNFTEGNTMQILRDALLEAAVKVLGPLVSDVLIVDIVRQDA